MSTSRLPDSTFFTDRDLGKRFPAILESAGLTVVRHGDHFAPDATDEEWLSVCGTRRWIAFSHNSRIRYTPNEVAAVMHYRVFLLILVGKIPTAELASSFVNTMPRITAFLAHHAPPWIAKVYRPSPSDLARRPEAQGRVELWHPRA